MEKITNSKFVLVGSNPTIVEKYRGKKEENVNNDHNIYNNSNSYNIRNIFIK